MTDCGPLAPAAAALSNSITKGKRYCLVCRDYEGKVMENGGKLCLHRIPDGTSQEKQKLRQSWIKSLKMMRSDLPNELKSHHRVCDQHFPNGFYPGAIPTRYTAESKTIVPRRVLERAPLPETITRKESKFTHPPEIASETEQVSELSEMHVSSQDLPKVSNTRDIGIQVGPGLQAKFNDCATQAKLPFLHPEDLKKSDEKTRFYTNFVSFGMLMYMFELFWKHGAGKLNYWDGEHSLNKKNYHEGNVKKPGPKRTLRPIDEFLILCMKLKLNLLQETLGDLFCVSTSTISRILNTWVNFCYDHSLSLIPWPSLEKIMQCLPPHFRDYPNCTIVLDCTEVFIEKPSSITAQWLTWSEYKHHNTVKILIGVTPNGMVNFVSRLWGGRASDRHITQHDNFLPKLQPNTTIMADKGFTVEDLLPVDVGLNMPPRVSSQRQMTDAEVFQTTGIASPRIVCEMKMEQAKNYRVISGVIPLSEAHLAEQMIFLCFAWTNFQPPLLK